MKFKIGQLIYNIRDNKNIQKILRAKNGWYTVQSVQNPENPENTGRKFSVEASLYEDSYEATIASVVAIKFAEDLKILLE